MEKTCSVGAANADERMMFCRMAHHQSHLPQIVAAVDSAPGSFQMASWCVCALTQKITFLP